MLAWALVLVPPKKSGKLFASIMDYCSYNLALLGGFPGRISKVVILNSRECSVLESSEYLCKLNISFPPGPQENVVSSARLQPTSWSLFSRDICERQNAICLVGRAY